MVLTTTRPETEVAQAVISNLVVSAGQVHFVVAADGATRATISRFTGVRGCAGGFGGGASVTYGEARGFHRFKVFGSNSNGSGPESAVVEATVSVAAA